MCGPDLRVDQAGAAVSCPDARHERLFSAVSYLKNKQRNRLDEPHLNLVVRFFCIRMFDLETFPFEEALKEWHAAAAKRGRYMGLDN